ncbi:hypothetical protein [Campylobacter fetus]|uniref:hypothetical protein n=1 Tax=Campylobacter fetus TaxID=196 RepID=UPI00138E0D8B|nr:hypothetical protein [Campylobacter fetus]
MIFYVPYSEQTSIPPKQIEINENLSGDEILSLINKALAAPNWSIKSNLAEIESLKSQIEGLSGGDLNKRSIVDIIYKSLLTNKLISFNFEAWKKSFTTIEPLVISNQIVMTLTQGGDYGHALAQVKFYDLNGTLLKNVVTSKIDEQNKYYVAVFDLLRDEEKIATFRMQVTNYYDSNYKVWHALSLANEEYSTASHYLLGSVGTATLTFTLEFLKEGERIPKMTFLPGVSSRYSSKIVVQRDGVDLFNKSGLSYSTLCEVVLEIPLEEIQDQIDAKYASCLPAVGE